MRVQLSYIPPQPHLLSRGSMTIGVESGHDCIHHSQGRGLRGGVSYDWGFLSGRTIFLELFCLSVSQLNFVCGKNLSLSVFFWSPLEACSTWLWVLPTDSFYPRISPHHPCKPGPPPWALSKPHFTQFSPSHVLSLTMS